MWCHRHAGFKTPKLYSEYMSMCTCCCHKCMIWCVTSTTWLQEPMQSTTGGTGGNISGGSGNGGGGSSGEGSSGEDSKPDVSSLSWWKVLAVCGIVGGGIVLRDRISEALGFGPKETPHSSEAASGVFQCYNPPKPPACQSVHCLLMPFCHPLAVHTSDL